MKQTPKFRNSLMASIALLALLLTACSSKEKAEADKADPVAANIKMYTQVWDEIMNKGKTELFNDSNFTKDVTFHMKPADVVGIDSAKAYYSQFLTGFSNIVFTMKDVFGQGDKLVKHWNFKGTHTGLFFGIPATGKPVDLDGATIVKMVNGKIAEEQDFFDNMDFMTQLGLVPPPGK
ncbi:MAG: ester cyclase [Chitinophagaceae bacterium]|nr:ester cyclase [Chitinophagaceae bacterium]